MNPCSHILFYLRAEIILPDSVINKWLSRSSRLTEKAADHVQMKAQEVVKLLQSNLDRGLESIEVENRLRQHGYNEVPERKANPAVRFAKKFWGLTAWMLEAIIILCYVDFFCVIEDNRRV